jgi:hypothetical protein
VKLKLGRSGAALPHRQWHLRRPSLRTVSAVSAILALGATMLAFTGPAAGVNTNHTGSPDARGFPRFYTDDSGLSLQLCDDGTAACLATGPNALTPPDGEALYWGATATIPTRRGDLDVEFALEAAFAGGPVVFDRLRIRGHLNRAGRYTLRHPYGTKRFRAASPREQRNVNVTVDLGCSLRRRGPCRGRIDNWLRSTRPRAGYLGAGEVPTRVTGGDVRNSVILRTRRGRLLGRTRQFAVVGKVAPGPAAAFSRTRADMGNTARRKGKTIAIRNLGGRRLSLGRLEVRGDNTFRIRRSRSTCDRTVTLRPGRTCRVSVRYRPTGKRLSTGRLVVRDNTRVGVHRLPLRAKTAAEFHARRRMHFTTRQVDTQSRRRRVIVENRGVIPLRIHAVFLRGRHDRSFVRRSGPGPMCSSGTRLRPGGACAVYVAFRPQSFGRKRSNIVVRSNALTSLDRIRLNGRGR